MSDPTHPFLPGSPGDLGFNDFLPALFRQLVAATVASNALPLGEDHDFYSSYGDVAATLGRDQTALLSTLQSLLRTVQPEKADRIDMLIGAGNRDDIADERFEKLVDAVDSMLERIDTIIDNEVTGVGKSEAATRMEDAARAAKPATVNKGAGSFSMVHSKNIVRPQLRWDSKVDNSNTPFVPLIAFKPNAIMPLEEVYAKHRDARQQSVTEGSGVGSAIETHMRDSLGYDSESKPNEDSYPHPYGPELDAFVPTDAMLDHQSGWVYRPLDETPLTYVDTVEALQELKDALNECQEFAVDLEAHQYRSFSGFTCLMQISTRDADYIVDTLELRSSMHILNEPFTNPSIVKVLHGADSDIVWLQRDFGIYVVNMFDTGQAARVLEFGRYSLAHLLNHYCQLTVDKTYQLADWRIRPLPSEMIKYAREDTHYLLYIYDRLRAELRDRGNANKNFLHAVWSRSTEICRRRFEKERWRPTSYLELFHKYSRNFNTTQLRVMQALYDWRDRTARLEDESTKYVFPTHMLFQTARLMPTDATGVLACCNPVPPLVRVHAQELAILIAQAIKAADEAPLNPEAEAALAGLGGSADASAAAGGAVAAHRVVASHHLYNPLGWHDDAAAPAVPIEQRLARCDVMEPCTSSALAKAISKAKLRRGHDSKAVRLAAKIMASFIDVFAAYTTPAPTTDGPMAAPAAPADSRPSAATAPAVAEHPAQAIAAPAQDAPAAAEPEQKPAADAPVEKEKKSNVTILSQLGRKRPAAPHSASASPAANAPDAKRARVQDSAPAPTSDFVPFDYSKAVLKDEKVASVEKLGAKKGGGGGGAGGFNPYESLQEAKFKSQPRANVTPKSGQRSMVYTGNSDKKKSHKKP